MVTVGSLGEVKQEEEEREREDWTKKGRGELVRRKSLIVCEMKSITENIEGEKQKNSIQGNDQRCTH